MQAQDASEPTATTPIQAGMIHAHRLQASQHPATRQLFSREKDRIDAAYDGEHDALKYAMNITYDDRGIAAHNKVILEDNLQRYFGALKRREKITVLEKMLLAGKDIDVSEQVATNMSKLYDEISKLNESILDGIEEVNTYATDKSQKTMLEEFKSIMGTVRKENKIRKLESAAIPDVRALVSSQSSEDKKQAIKYLGDEATKKYLSDENIRIRQKYVPYYEAIADALCNDGCGLAKEEKKIFEELLGRSFSALELAERTLAVDTALLVNGIYADEAIYHELAGIFRNVDTLNEATDKELKKIIANSLLVSDEFVTMYPGMSDGAYLGLRIDKTTLKQAMDSLLPDEREKVEKNIRKIPPELFGMYRDAVYMTNGLRMQFEHNVKSPEESKNLGDERKTGEAQEQNVETSQYPSFGAGGRIRGI